MSSSAAGCSPPSVRSIVSSATCRSMATASRSTARPRGRTPILVRTSARTRSPSASTAESTGPRSRSSSSQPEARHRRPSTRQTTDPARVLSVRSRISARLILGMGWRRPPDPEGLGALAVRSWTPPEPENHHEVTSDDPFDHRQHRWTKGYGSPSPAVPGRPGSPLQNRINWGPSEAGIYSGRTISIRRFCCRPAGLSVPSAFSFGATGLVSPKLTVRRSEPTPASRRAAAKASARRAARSWL